MSMSTENGRVALAEAMGWKVDIVTTNPVTDEPIESWQSPDGSYSRFSPPDPFTDANDCQALIRHLQGVGITVHISFNTDEDGGWNSVSSEQSKNWPAADYIGDDYKQGVCELALKVLDKNTG